MRRFDLSAIPRAMSEIDLVVIREQMESEHDRGEITCLLTIGRQLADEVEKLWEPLKFYADTENYKEQLQNAGDCGGINWVLSDNGAFARSVLPKVSEENS